MADSTAVRLPRPPRLMPALGKGVMTGIGKRPRADAPLPGTRLVIPEARIDLGRLCAYARVCGFSQTRPLPLTYPHVLGFPLTARLMADRAFPLPLLGLVHTSAEIRQWAPLSTEDVLELGVHAEGLRAHRRGTTATIVTEARRDGELVWQGRCTYLARRGHPARPDRDRRTARAAELLPARATWALPADLGRRHAAATGDYHPIHLYPWTAKPLGFPRAIAHGIWSFARCVAESGASLAEQVFVRAEFTSPVLLPSTVTYAAAGQAFQLRGGPDGRRIHLAGQVVRGATEADDGGTRSGREAAVPGPASARPGDH
ncbi:MaoC family dehydratase [Streptomyces sp. NPDC001922]|uniref:MaoC family dehydratase n=1 Tax=Streptomyces sp. NPDC001922 TaxID=3364624 RepID=UPI0036A4F463